MARPLTPQQLAEATEDWDAIVRTARHLNAEDFDPWWQRAAWRAWRGLCRLDDVLFTVSDTPWLDAACVVALLISTGLCLAAWLLPS